MKYQNKKYNYPYKTDLYLSRFDYTTLNDVVKKFIKPNLKEINTFKKILKKHS